MIFDELLPATLDPADHVCAADEAADLLAQLLARPAWHEHAACRKPEHQHVDFFRQRGASLAAARAVCATCPVIEQCAAAGIGERHGVWAGTSERDRRRLRVANRGAA